VTSQSRGRLLLKLYPICLILPRHVGKNLGFPSFNPAMAWMALILNTINSATHCSVMLPPIAMECCHLVCKVSSTPKACGAARLRFDQDDVRFEFR
jgi:hypothetical protein